MKNSYRPVWVDPGVCKFCFFLSKMVQSGSSVKMVIEDVRKVVLLGQVCG